jgi:signal transduction histidine kinase
MHLVAIVQEALSNALQHANATEIQVNTRCLSTPGAWCVEVCDNGQGFLPPFNQEDCPALGHGMAGMARRASLAGGELQVFADQRGGTCIRVVAPYAAVP